jgi:hypothetical protein
MEFPVTTHNKLSKILYVKISLKLRFYHRRKFFKKNLISLQLKYIIFHSLSMVLMRNNIFLNTVSYISVDFFHFIESLSTDTQADNFGFTRIK